MLCLRAAGREAAGADVAASAPAGPGEPLAGFRSQAAMRGSSASVYCHSSELSWVWKAAPV